MVKTPDKGMREYMRILMKALLDFMTGLLTMAKHVPGVSLVQFRGSRPELPKPKR